jgi:hypothetical protein
MPDVHENTKTMRLALTGKKAKAPLEPLKVGMPALDSIHDDKTEFTPIPGGATYRIIKTTEVDSYETTPTAVALSRVLRGKGAPKAAALAKAVKRPPAPVAGGNQFAGTARKAAKLSIAAAPSENFNDLSDLIASLPSIDAMVNHKPLITTASTSKRVAEENRNVHVNAFLYAASREADNDFHLIIGRDPSAGQEMYMTMEISGLPPTNYPAFAKMNAARNAYTQFFGAANLPGAGYHFYQPPIPAKVDGSLFFDMTHATGQAPGPPSLKSRMPTIWEVHPISGIKLG